jgi:hypothetical protein
MRFIDDIAERCAAFFATKKDYWIHSGLVARADILFHLAQVDTGHRPLTSDYYLVAALYATVLHTDISVDYHISQLRILIDDYDPSMRYTSFQEQIHGSLSYRRRSLSRDQRRLLHAFDRFTLRYPDFDYQQFFDGYFPAVTKIPSSHAPATVIPFRSRRSA